MPDTLRARLKEAAFSYLARQSASAARVKEVLTRRLSRWRAAAGLDPEDKEALVGEVLADLVRLDLINDRRFARQRAEALARRGLGPPAVAARLRRLGVDQAVVEAVLAEVFGEADERTRRLLAAALAYARRRGLGPFADAKNRRLDARARARALAAFARRGLPLELARLIVEAQDERDLEDRLGTLGLSLAGLGEW